MVGFGCGMGWLSMALPLLQSDNSPLESGKISVNDMSWIGSVISLGALFGNCFFGFIVTIIGARHTIFLIGFPQLVSHTKWTQETVHHLSVDDKFSFQMISGQLVILNIWNESVAFGHFTIFKRFCRWRCSTMCIPILG